MAGGLTSSSSSIPFDVKAQSDFGTDPKVYEDTLAELRQRMAALDDPGRKSAAFWAAAGQPTRGGSLAESFSNGALSQAQAQREDDKLKAGYMPLMMSAIEASQQAQMQHAALVAQRNRVEANARLLGGGQQSAPQYRLGTGPTLPAGMLPPEQDMGQQMPPIARPIQQGQGNTLANLQAAIRAGTSLEDLDKLDKLRNFGRDKIEAQFDGVNSQGAPVTKFRTAYGVIPGDGEVQWKAPVHINNGATNDFVSPVTMKNVGSFKISNSPGELLSSQTTRRGQDMADARARMTQDMVDARARDAQKGQVVQTDNGPVLVNTITGSGRMITGPDGNPLPGVTKPLNDNQSKALLFGSRMREADKILSTLGAEGTTTSIPGSRTPFIGGVINSLSSENQQMLDQAKRDFLNAVLRRESGAAISAGEFDNADKQYFPQINDGEKVIAQKARNRELAMHGVLIEVPEKMRGSLQPSPQERKFKVLGKE